MRSSLRRALLNTLSLAWAFGISTAQGQVPTKCLEIERILVDACIDATACPSGQEGQNEMVSFRVGPQPIALADLEADWPNNSWNGLVQNATTAELTADLNSTIAACGQLLEPVGGILPAGSKVLMVTSTAMCTQANSFTNLTDTLYIVFQAPGNVAGHFANQNNGNMVSATPSGAESLRTLIIHHLPSGCSDTTTYDRSQLVNVLGTYGGTSAQNDGATAVFTWPGIPQVSYVNFGCQAPIVPTEVIIDGVNGSLCGSAGTVQLQASVTGPFLDVAWQGGTGTFGDDASLTTSYTAGSGDQGAVVLTLCATLQCGDQVCTDVTLPTGTAPSVVITPSGSTALCPGQSVTLVASGADSYDWGGQQNTPGITVTQAGTYTVTGTNACGTSTASVTVTTGNAPVVTIIPDGPTSFCTGDQVVLTATGADSYLWNTQQAGPSIVVTQAGTYSVVGTTACGQATAQVSIIVTTPPVVTISASGPLVLCPGDQVVLTASGADSYQWSDQQSSTSIVVTQPGLYSVTGIGICGQASAQVTITAGSAPTVSISPAGPVVLCPDASVELTASGAATYLWSTQQTGNAITVDGPGTYTVVGTTACGQASAQVVVSASDVAASFDTNVAAGFAPLQVLFTNTSSPAGGSSSWTFGGDGQSLTASPAHTFNEPGTYVVVLSYTANGCTSTAQATIVVGSLPVGTSTLVVPNVFSPNGDGFNDRFLVETEFIADLEMPIYNRWGQKVAQLNAPREAWDARTFAGEVAPDGTYFYVLTARGTDGKMYELKGTITLVR